MGLSAWRTPCNGWFHCLKNINMKRKYVSWGIQLVNIWHLLDMWASSFECSLGMAVKYSSGIPQPHQNGRPEKEEVQTKPCFKCTLFLSLSLSLFSCSIFFSAAISSIHQDQRQYRREVSKSSSNVYSREERRRSGLMADSSDFLTIGGRGSSSSVIILPSQVSCGGGTSEPSVVQFNS